MFVVPQLQVFFIDHKFKVTTFIDPRLPLPDTVFTYTTREASNSMAATRRSVLFEDQQIRPHHVTTVSTSSSVSEMDTPPRDETTPTPSDGTPTPSEGDGSSVSENSVGPPSKFLHTIIRNCVRNFELSIYRIKFLIAFQIS